MGEVTAIGWCDATINFWHGCEKVSEGCKYCYMYRDKEKYGQSGNEIKKTKAPTINKILLALAMKRMERAAAGNFEPLKIFTCSWSDFFLKEADEWRAEAWEIIRQHPEYIWIILTKRIDRVQGCLPPDWREGWPNVWLLVSAENQDRWNERVPVLLNTRAKVRGVSVEPMLGPVDVRNTPRLNDLDWIIVGGESGNDTGKWLYRPCDVAWIDDVVFAARSQGIQVFVKQLGTFLSKQYKIGRVGEDMTKWPVELTRIMYQDFPIQPKP